VRLCQMIIVAVVGLLFVGAARAQSPNGTISGTVFDPLGRVIPGAEITVVNDATRVQSYTKTNGDGVYVVPNLPPGSYRLQVTKFGFKTLIKPDITLNVQDALAINFTLPVGAVAETVTVEGGAPLVNTGSGSVSTVIGQNLVQNLPLNGRSFNTLLQLTPGVVIAPSSSSNQGQFSIAGQRTSANSFMVDGVSANFGVSQFFGLGTSGTGSAQAFSALGGTSSLVSVEALQEFRVETSSFAPEFGRSPGGQVILTTRSGTNDIHGGLYEYFRNNVLDANDWFADQAGQPKAAERHNDFGGFLGGPIERDRTFFFVSYEGARLRQPNTMIVQVPSEYARSIASTEIAPFLNAYPKPDDQTVTPGVYAANFTGNYSDPSTLNAGSVRIDHTFNSKWAIFGRYNEAPSETAVRSDSLNEVDTTQVGTRTATLGLTGAITPKISNSLRGNYSMQSASVVNSLDSFGGAVPPPLNVLGPGLADGENSYLLFGDFDTGVYATGPSAKNRSTQLNFADDLTVVRGTHQLKFGADYRAIYLDVRPYQSAINYIVFDLPTFLSTGQALVQGESTHPSQFLIQSTSLYGQDTWKVTSRLTLIYGLRWELEPAPSARGGTMLASWEHVDQPAELTLAPAGTPLWGTTYTDFAPRFGAAYMLTPNGDFVLRGGVGIFYDSGADAAGYLASSFPNDSANCCATASLPVSDATTYLPVISTQPPYSGIVRGYSPNLKLPRSYQWNVALEKSFGGKQAVSITYLGQTGRNLLREEGLAQPNANFASTFILTENDTHSNYNALQLQFRRPVSNRLQALLNYTWSHSLDNASNDVINTVSNSVISTANDYASSSFDVRQSFSGALVYSVPAASKGRVLEQLSKNWSVETQVVARTGFPFNGTVLTANVGGANPRPDLVPGQPIWIANPQAGGGKSLNPNAFTMPPSGEQGTEGRNDIRGFGLTEVDASVGRKFAITDRLNLQFRADAFNLFNHPNFANPLAYVGFGPTYLSSSSMLNHGLGGLNPLFQEGGPRSLQLSLKLTF
jgi:Carboxypeptidase regulatory-like domain/TonB dependent receptor-like, beta-barrel/TonB-dependent Receptor Plug Domain